MAEYDTEEPLTSTTRPETSAIITVRVIKSFAYRTERNIVIRDIDLTKTTVGELKEQALKTVERNSGFRAFRTVKLDTMKIYTKAHGAKTVDLIINLNQDEWFLDDDTKTLAEYGVENETEISFFNRELYEEYKKHPVEKW